MNQIINYTRLTTSDRLSDRFATCQVYEPADSEKAKRGKLFLHIEIMGQWLVNSQIGQTVINTLIREYYKDNSRSGLSGFESAIKKVNETLAGIAQGGETDWIGRFSGVIVLIQNTDIHFAQTGSSHSYLYRSNKVNFVTENVDAETSPHPLKTFTNITSGNLDLFDKIVIANKTFFDNIRPSELKLMVNSESPTLCVINCAKILKSRSIRTASAIIIEITTKKNLADLPVGEKIETIYIDHSYVTIFGKIKKIAKKTSIIFIQGILKLFSSLETTKNTTFKKVKLHTEKHNYTERNSVTLSKANPLFKSVNLLKQPEKNKILKSAANSTRINNIIKFKNKLKRLLIRIRLYPQKKQHRTALAFSIVISILLLTISYSAYKNFRSNKLAKSNKQNNEIQLLIEETTKQIEAADKDKAAELFEKVLKYDLNNLNDRSLKEINEKIDILKQRYFLLAGITVIRPQKIFKLKNNPLITSASDGFYILENFADLSFLDVDTLEIKKQSEFSDLDNIKQIFYVDEIATIGLSSGDKILTSDPIEPLITENKIATGLSKIKTFGSNIYFKNDQANQILKSAIANNKLSEASTYLKENHSEKIEDFSIDGSIYTIDSNNKIRRFSRGKQVAIIESPTGSINWTNIETSEDSTNIFLSGKDQYGYRIAKIKKNGEITGQFEIENLDIENLIFLPQRNLLIAIIGQSIEVYSL